MGPSEMRRYVGPELADALHLSGPMVVATATLPSATFVDDGRSYHYYDGMTGWAEARVRSETLLLSLFPILKVLWRADD